MYCFPNDTGVSTALREFGEYAVIEVALYHRLLEPGDVFIDVGANIGAITRGVASAASRPRVICFEPHLATYQLLLANTLGRDGITCYPLAVSDRSGMIAVPEIDSGKAANYGAFALDGTRGVPCPTVRLDEFLRPRAPAPRLVKIDVEGMEAAVLRGLSGLLHERLVVSVEADRRDKVPEILEEMRDFTIFAVFFRVIRSSNPKFDRARHHCKVRHVHLVGFAGAPPPLDVPGLWPVRTPADFDQLWRKYFGADPHSEAGPVPGEPG